MVNREKTVIYGIVFFGDEECRLTNRFYPENCPQGDIFWQLLQTNFIPCQSGIFRRKCLCRTGLLDESIPGIDDWDLWMRIVELYTVIAVEETVAIWRQPTFTSGQISLHSERMQRLHRKKWLQLARAPGSLDQPAARNCL